MMDIIIVMAASYLLGSFPTGIIAGRLTKGIDLRDHGSGNTGATNSTRVLGWKVGLIVGLIDMAKGWVAVSFIARIRLLDAPPVPAQVLFIAATLAVVMGHIKPIFAGFRGGKGFGTAAGAVSAAYPPLAPLCLAVFLVTLVLSGYVAVAAAVAALALPLFYLLVSAVSEAPVDPAILIFFILIFPLTVLGVRKKLRLYFSGNAELFEKIMIIKPKRERSKSV